MDRIAHNTIQRRQRLSLTCGAASSGGRNSVNRRLKTITYSSCRQSSFRASSCKIRRQSFCCCQDSSQQLDGHNHFKWTNLHPRNNSNSRSLLQAHESLLKATSSVGQHDEYRLGLGVHLKTEGASRVILAPAQEIPDLVRKETQRPRGERPPSIRQGDLD